MHSEAIQGLHLTYYLRPLTHMYCKAFLPPVTTAWLCLHTRASTWVQRLHQGTTEYVVSSCHAGESGPCPPGQGTPRLILCPVPVSLALSAWPGPGGLSLTPSPSSVCHSLSSGSRCGSHAVGVGPCGPELRMEGMETEKPPCCRVAACYSEAGATDPEGHSWPPWESLQKCKYSVSRAQP